MDMQIVFMLWSSGSEAHTIPSLHTWAVNRHKGPWSLPPRTPVKIDQSHEAEMNFFCLLHPWESCCNPLHLQSPLHQFSHWVPKISCNIGKACFSPISQIRKLMLRVIGWLAWGHRVSLVSLISLSNFLHHSVPQRATGSQLREKVHVFVVQDEEE